MTNLVSLAEMEVLAGKQLPKEVFDFFIGGANDEYTLLRNGQAFENIMLMPRVLAGVHNPNSSVEIFNLSLDFPVIAAPMAFQCLAHPEGEVAMARALRTNGLVYIASTMATVSLEDITQKSLCPSWFQLYIYKDRGLTLELVQRAIAAHYKAIVVTVDVPVMGKRERDIRNQFHLPEKYSAANFNDFLRSDLGLKPSASAIKSFTDKQFDPSLSWKDIEWLKQHCPLPLIIKGILRDSDAEIAINEGIDGIVVSNHGGRQLDGVPAAIECLPKIAKKVNKRVPLMMDGGIKRGTDIIKAIALGASAVLIGRPLLWGLAVNGEQGVTDVITTLKNEFMDAMLLCGYGSVAEIANDRELIL